MEAENVLIAEPLDPVLETIIVVTLGVLLYVGPIASVLISVFSKNWVIVLGTCLLSAAGFLVVHFEDPLALFAGSAIQVGGLLLAIGGVQSRRRWAAVWDAVEELSTSVHAPSIVPDEERSRSVAAPERQTLRDANNFAVAYVYFESEPGRRVAANLMTKDEARRIAAGIAKLPELLKRCR
jgi:hypothetical protein